MQQAFSKFLIVTFFYVSTAFAVEYDVEMQSYLDQKGFSDGVVVVMQKGDILFKKGYGYLDKSPDTALPLASMSKVFTQIAIHQLIEEKKLSLDTRVATYLGIEDEVSCEVRKITVGHLLKHEGGWDREVSGDPLFALKETKKKWKLNKNPSREAFAKAILTNTPLDFSPGGFVSYSNLGYLILGTMIEKATGQDYLDAINERVTKPLGAHLKIANVPRFLAHYPEAPSIDYFSLELAAPSFGLSMSASDLALTCDKLIDDKFLEQGNFIQYGSLPDLTTGMIRKKSNGQTYVVIIPSRNEATWQQDTKDLGAIS